MDLENLGKQILECLAVQGKITSIEKEMAQRNVQIAKSEDEEKKRLEVVKVANTAAKKEVAQLGTELTDLRQELKVRLVELEENGVDIDLGKSAPKKISL